MYGEAHLEWCESEQQINAVLDVLPRGLDMKILEEVVQRYQDAKFHDVDSWKRRAWRLEFDSWNAARLQQGLPVYTPEEFTYMMYAPSYRCATVDSIVTQEERKFILEALND